MEYPTVEELQRRVTSHLSSRGSTSEVVHLWNGYLAALVEWGLIERRAYISLSRLVREVNVPDLYQLFADEPLPQQLRVAEDVQD